MIHVLYLQYRINVPLGQVPKIMRPLLAPQSLKQLPEAGKIGPATQPEKQWYKWFLAMRSHAEGGGSHITAGGGSNMLMITTYFWKWSTHVAEYPEKVTECEKAYRDLFSYLDQEGILTGHCDERLPESLGPPKPKPKKKGKPNMGFGF
jgi:hypothetical protein